MKCCRDIQLKNSVSSSQTKNSSQFNVATIQPMFKILKNGKQMAQSAFDKQVALFSACYVGINILTIQIRSTSNLKFNNSYSFNEREKKALVI